jgi:hypothetical protein
VAPLFDEDLCFLEAAEDFAIEQLVPHDLLPESALDLM